MLLYFSYGRRDYRRRPIRLHTRRGWEFQAVLAGRISPTREDGSATDGDAFAPARRRLWVFGPRCAHGWGGDRRGARVAVWHTPRVHPTLAQHVGLVGAAYVDLSDEDVKRLGALARLTTAHYPRSTSLTGPVSDAVLAQLTLLALRDRPVHRPAHPNHNTQHARDTFARAVAWFREHLPDNPSVDDAAHALAISEPHLRRLFRQAGQASPRRVFNTIRADEAEHLLRTTDWKVAVIAAAVGYAGPQAFTRAFREIKGRTPASVRQ